MSWVLMPNNRWLNEKWGKRGKLEAKQENFKRPVKYNESESSSNDSLYHISV